MAIVVLKLPDVKQKTAGGILDPVMDIGVELSFGSVDPEWLKGCHQSYDDLAQCTGGKYQAQETETMAIGTSNRVGWRVCARLGRKTACLVAVDLGTGDPLAVGYVNEHDPQAVQRWLTPLVQRHGISVIVTDDLFSYRVVTDKLQLGHQVCQFHVRHWVGRSLHDLATTLPKDWLWVLEEVRTLLEVLHPEGGKRLHALWKQLPGRHSGGKTLSPLERLRDLLLRLAQTWQRYCTFQSEPQVPWTNNATERAIGRMKPVLSLLKG